MAILVRPLIWNINNSLFNVCFLLCDHICWSDDTFHVQVGSSCSGKSSAVHTLAQLCGYKLVEFPMNTDTDTTELLGGFQQVC